MTACQAATGESLGNTHYMKIMKELCISSGTLWTLKESPQFEQLDDQEDDEEDDE